MPTNTTRPEPTRQATRRLDTRDPDGTLEARRLHRGGLSLWCATLSSDPNATNGENAMTTEHDPITLIPAEHRDRANAIIDEAMRRSAEAEGAPHPSGLSQYYRDRSGQPLPAWADQVHEWAMNGDGDWLGDYCVIEVEESDRERLGLRADTAAVTIIGNAVEGLNVSQLDAHEYALALSAMTHL